MKEEEEREKEEKERREEREREKRSQLGGGQAAEAGGPGQNNMEETTLGRPTRGKAGLARYWRANMKY